MDAVLAEWISDQGREDGILTRLWAELNSYVICLENKTKDVRGKSG